MRRSRRSGRWPLTLRAQRQAGRWVLAATILGSSMAFIDSTVVNVALPALQANLHATVVGVQWVVESYGLVLGSIDSRWRLPRRLVWPPIDVPGWRRDFRGCFYRLWFCLEHSAAGDRAECPGCGSCLSGARQPFDYQRMFRRENSRPSDRYMVRLHCDHNSVGARSRRLADRACLLALGIFHQCSDRGRGDRNFAVAYSRKPQR